MRETTAQWLDRHVSYSSDDCLIWPYSYRADGRGQAFVDGRIVPAHRSMCRKANGPPPSADHHAAHSCGRGAHGCVNPKHLRWATKTENEADKLLHGTSPRGERCGTSKLKEDDVRQIRAMRGAAPYREICTRFHISMAQVSRIMNGARWAWLDQ